MCVCVCVQDACMFVSLHVVGVRIWCRKHVILFHIVLSLEFIMAQHICKYLLISR